MKKYLLIALLIASGSLTTEAQTSKFDLNDDGKLDVTDITVLVDAIMSGVGEAPRMWKLSTWDCLAVRCGPT